MKFSAMSKIINNEHGDHKPIKKSNSASQQKAFKSGELSYKGDDSRLKTVKKRENTEKSTSIEVGMNRCQSKLIKTEIAASKTRKIKPKFVTPTMSKSEPKNERNSAKEEMLKKLHHYRGIAQGKVVGPQEVKGGALDIDNNENVINEKEIVVIEKDNIFTGDEIVNNKVTNQTCEEETPGLDGQSNHQAKSDFQTTSSSLNLTVEESNSRFEDSELSEIRVSPGKSKSASLHLTKSSKSTSKLSVKKHTCIHCGRGFSYLTSWSHHQVKCTAVHKCTPCEMVFKSRKTLKQHVKKVHERPVFKCAHCTKTFATEKQATAHISFTHEQKECNVCQKMCKNSNALRSHKYTAHGGKSKAKGSPLVDTKQVVSVVRWLCELCDSEYESKNALMKHKRAHSEADKLLCLANCESSSDTDNVMEDSEAYNM